MSDSPIQGNLFANDFLQDTIKELPEWSDFDDARLDALIGDLKAIFTIFPTSRHSNDRQTEDDLIWPVLARLGGSVHGRGGQGVAGSVFDDVPYDQ